MKKSPKKGFSLTLSQRAVYLTVGKTLLERGGKLLSKLDSIGRSRERALLSWRMTGACPINLLDRYQSSSRTTDPVPCSALWDQALTAIYPPFQGGFTHRQIHGFFSHFLLNMVPVIFCFRKIPNRSRKSNHKDGSDIMGDSPPNWCQPSH